MTEGPLLREPAPSATPRSWAEMRGRAPGRTRSRRELSWTGRREYDLDDTADDAGSLRGVAVLIDAVTIEVIDRVMNGERLRALWPELFLPAGFERWPGAARI